MDRASLVNQHVLCQHVISAGYSIDWIFICNSQPSFTSFWFPSYCSFLVSTVCLTGCFGLYDKKLLN